MISRTMTGWRWYRDANTFRVFFHLMINANYKEHDFENITVRRGQLVTSRKTLAAELGISEQNVRTALRHLKSTGEITSSETSKFTLITVINYDKYQASTGTSTGDQPAVNQKLTGNQPQCNKDNKDNKEKNIVPDRKIAEFSNAELAAMLETW